MDRPTDNQRSATAQGHGRSRGTPADGAGVAPGDGYGPVTAQGYGTRAASQNTPKQTTLGGGTQHSASSKSTPADGAGVAPGALAGKLPVAPRHGKSTPADTAGVAPGDNNHGNDHGPATAQGHGTRHEMSDERREAGGPAHACDWSTRWRRGWWKGYAFLLRDARIETTYKFQFLWSLATVVFTIATLYFVAQLVPPGGRALGRYRGDYFSFAVVGVVMARYLETALTGITMAVRQAMTQGTIEIMFVSPTRAMTILSLSAAWHFLFETIRVVFCLALAAACFGLRLEQPNWAGAVVTLLLTIPAFLSLGVMSAGLLILLKRGDPVNWFAVGMASLLGGVMFPVELLPAWLRAAAYAVPLTHSLEGFRATLLLGRSTGELWGSLAPLLLFSAVMLPTAWLVSRQALQHAKRRGSLGTY